MRGYGKGKGTPEEEPEPDAKAAKGKNEKFNLFCASHKKHGGYGCPGKCFQGKRTPDGAITVGPHFILSKTEGAQRNAPGPPGRLLRPQLQEAHCFTTTYWRMVNLQRKHRR